MKKKNEIPRETIIAAMLACPAVVESIRAAGELPLERVAASLPALGDRSDRLLLALHEDGALPEPTVSAVLLAWRFHRCQLEPEKI